MDRNEFEEDKHIDPSQLDVEACRQADVFFKWAEKAIDARAEADRLKFKHDVTETRIQLLCREHPEKYGIVKLTEASVQAAVKCNEDRIEQWEEYLKARRNSAMLDKAVEAMEMRKRMIEVLITLHGQKYFAGPSVPRDLVGAWQENQVKASARLMEKETARAEKREERRAARKKRQEGKK